MEPIYTKVDETTLKMTAEVPVEQKETTYNLDFLRQQELDILKQKNDFVEARNAELEEVRNLIAKCEELGVKSSLEIETAKEITLEEVNPIIK